MKFSKKAQMEIVGLVVIVILLTLGMLFIAKFVMQTDSSGKEIFTRRFLASSTLGAMLDTNYDCPALDHPPTIADLLEACVEDPNRYDCEFGFNNCMNSYAVVENLTNSTLGDWGKKYYFSASLLAFGDATPLDLFDDGVGGDPCLGEKDSEERVLQTTNGILKLHLEICGKN